MASDCPYPVQAVCLPAHPSNVVFSMFASHTDGGIHTSHSAAGWLWFSRRANHDVSGSSLQIFFSRSSGNFYPPPPNERTPSPAAALSRQASRMM